MWWLRPLYGTLLGVKTLAVGPGIPFCWGFVNGQTLCLLREQGGSSGGHRAHITATLELRTTIIKNLPTFGGAATLRNSLGVKTLAVGPRNSFCWGFVNGQTLCLLREQGGSSGVNGGWSFEIVKPNYVLIVPPCNRCLKHSEELCYPRKSTTISYIHICNRRLSQKFY
ncbi:hypothetical protein CEXT_51011 [Caerostris extrusa]|uniref:Secreted protein n=1 Tax=Caerostris extrusa TaxID=172846 RepID=A0AAV4MN95_CAEEX|nr:hypothetical protein CEXT_51011 [Caerostris extrusa]